jgi:peroxiredoxin Q/BCP
MLEEGKAAPAFSLLSAEGDKISLASLIGGAKGKCVVVYFYPRDDTPGCTREAQAFSAALPKLAKFGAAVVGISKDTVESHCKFRDKYKLKFPLLSDPERKAIEAYGAWGEKNNYGKKSMGIVRTTVVVGSDGKVKKVFSKVKVDGHVDKVLAVLEDLAKG